MDELGKLSAENRSLREQLESMKASSQAHASAKKQLWLEELGELKQAMKDGLKNARSIYPPYYSQGPVGMVRSKDIDHIVASITIPDEELRGWAKEFIRVCGEFAQDWFDAGQQARRPPYGADPEERNRIFLEGRGTAHIAALEKLYSSISVRIDELLS